MTKCIHDSCLLFQTDTLRQIRHKHTNTHMLPKPAVTAVSYTLGGHMPSCPDSDTHTYCLHRAPIALYDSLSLSPLIHLTVYIILKVDMKKMHHNIHFFLIRS